MSLTQDHITDGRIAQRFNPNVYIAYNIESGMWGSYYGSGAEVIPDYAMDPEAALLLLECLAEKEQIQEITISFTSEKKWIGRVQNKDGSQHTATNQTLDTVIRETIIKSQKPMDRI